MKKLFTLPLLLFVSFLLAFPSMKKDGFGTIMVQVTDASTNDIMPYVTVSLFKDSSLIRIEETDNNGEYCFKPVAPGLYTMKFSFIGYNELTISTIEVDDDVITKKEVQLKAGTGIDLMSFNVIASSNCNHGGVLKTVTLLTDVKTISIKGGTTIDYAGTAPGVIDDGKGLSTSGGRDYSTTYYIDGVKVRGALTFPTSSISSSSYSSTSTSPSSSYNSSLTNKLTAGEINDFSKWTLWKDIESNTLKEYKTQWMIEPDSRYSVQLETECGMPVINADVQLLDKSKTVLWETKTDNTGKAELWQNIYSDKNDSKNISINIISSDGKSFSIENPKEFHDGINIKKISVDCNVNDAIDIAFVVDATGSMQDEINYLKAELDNIIYKVKDSLPKTELNVGCVFYRDNVDAFLTFKSDLTADIKTTIDFIGETSAAGGGDFPEAVDAGLKTAVNDLKWRDEATARIIFLVLDAPPHQTPECIAELQKQIELAAKKGIRIVPVACSGVDKSTEYLMRSFALTTNGTYIFLNDKSGIGSSHIEPTTDSYKTEFLNGIIYRTICNFSHTTSCVQTSLVENTAADTITVYNPLLQNTKIDTAKNGVDTSQMVNSKIANDTSSTLTSWKYFPNPTMGKLHISISGNIEEFFVTDISGKILQRIAAKKQHDFDIDLTDFSAGIYFIAYEYTPGKMLTGKLLLEH